MASEAYRKKARSGHLLDGVCVARHDRLERAELSLTSEVVCSREASFRARDVIEGRPHLSEVACAHVPPVHPTRLSPGTGVVMTPAATRFPSHSLAPCCRLARLIGPGCVTRLCV